jgi:hypothetical protein
VIDITPIFVPDEFSRVPKIAVTPPKPIVTYTPTHSLTTTTSSPSTRMPSHKSFRTKIKLAKAARQNRPVPQWIRLRYLTLRSLKLIVEPEIRSSIELLCMSWRLILGGMLNVVIGERQS